MSDRHLQWLMMMTGPCAAAEKSVSNDSDVKNVPKPGKDRIWVMRLVWLSNSFRCFTTVWLNGSISSLLLTSPLLGQKIWDSDVVSASRS